jgi:YbbR domain-containing protein
MAYNPLRHFALKVLSLAIAVALWFAVSGEQTIERTVHAPLAFQNQSETLEFVDSPPSTVDVRVRGAASLVSHLSTGDVVVMLDLSTARSGKKIFHLTPSQVRAPFGVDVMQVSPGDVSLSFEPSVTKMLPVIPVLEGEPALGYKVGKWSVDPPAVAVIGPESSLRHLKSAVTEAVSVANATSRIRQTVNVGVPDPSARLQMPVVVTVTVPIDAVPVERLVEDVPVRVRDVRPGLAAQVAPQAVAVSTRGPKTVLDTLEGGHLVAYVDLAGLAPGRYNLPVRVEPPQNVEIVQTQPAAVRVRIR